MKEQPVRIILNAPAVAKLVKLDPEHTMELAKSAAAQVAQEIANRVAHEVLEAKMKAWMDKELSPSQVAPKYQQVLKDTMQLMAQGFIQDLASGSTSALINLRVVDALNRLQPEIERQLTLRADQVIRERFSALFGPSPTPAPEPKPIPEDIEEPPPPPEEGKVNGH